MSGLLGEPRLANHHVGSPRFLTGRKCLGVARTELLVCLPYAHERDRPHLHLLKSKKAAMRLLCLKSHGLAQEDWLGYTRMANGTTRVAVKATIHYISGITMAFPRISFPWFPLSVPPASQIFVKGWP